MIRSMTGYGKHTLEMPDKTVTLEVKSLNSKQADISIKTPQPYKEKDLEIRNMLIDRLERGKIDFVLYVEDLGGEGHFSINHMLARKYFKELKQLSSDLDIDESNDYLSILIRIPEVLQTRAEELDPDEWVVIRSGISKAIEQLEGYRQNEGQKLAVDLKKRIKNIADNIKKIDPFEERRKKSVEEKILKALEGIECKVDENRFEQEMIYYLEKLDITEERVRLEQHLQYFLETMESEEPNGKKLNFISQEMGREINTMGAKANDVDIQKLVVQMKDELEKIKEQLSNIL